MKLHSKFARPAGHGSLDPKWLLWSGWLAAMLVVTPVAADRGVGAEEAPAELGVPVSAVEVDDARLQGVQARGVDPVTLRADENVGVILWDEPGTGRRNGQPIQSGNSLATVRYVGPERQ